MFIYFDTEFTGLQKDTNLISIGLISADGKEFYAEVSDIDVDSQSDWIISNVLVNTAYYGCISWDDITTSDDCYFGTLDQISVKLQEWFSQFDEIQLVSDVCHYDMVLLISMFGTAFDLPNNVCAACHDINQDIARYEHITDRQAFDRSREDFVLCYGEEIPGNKHNALYDAKVIREIHNIVRGIK